MSGGQLGALMHPSELLTIGGAAMGAMIMMSPISVLKNLGIALIGTLKGSQYDKATYRELFKLMYDLLRIARRDGLLMLERHVSDPHHSEVINRYPRIAKNHHAMEFICNGLSPLVDGATPEQVSGLLEAELKIIEEEHHAPISVMTKTADGLPGFGIVAAVLGIVITMGAIDGPVQEVGHKVGAALVGTFLGILLSYGFFGPLGIADGIHGRRGTGLLPRHRLDRDGGRAKSEPQGRDRTGPPGHRHRIPTQPHRNGSPVQGSRRDVSEA